VRLKATKLDHPSTNVIDAYNSNFNLFWDF